MLTKSLVGRAQVVRMRVVQTVIKAGLALLLALNCAPGNAGGHEVLVGNTTVISPERDEVLTGAWVHIRDGRIVEVSTRPLKLEQKHEYFDAEGRYLIPGLMDSHVHLGRMPGMLLRDSEHLEHLKRIYVRQEPRSYLYFGVTQLVDLATAPQAVQQFNQQAIRPDLFHCGATPILGGYPTVFADSDEQAIGMFPYYIDEKAEPGRQHSPSEVVMRMHDEGAICVKVHIEDGFGDRSDWPVLSESSVRALQQQAQIHSMPVLAHANAFDMQLMAEQLDVDIIAHGMWNWNQHRGKPGVPAEVQRLLDRIVAKGIYYQPTLTVIDALKQTVEGQGLDDPLYRKSTPSQLLQWYATPEAGWFKEELIAEAGGVSAETIIGWQSRTYAQGARVVRYLADNGGRLLLASDTPSSPVAVSQPGYNTHVEMKYMAAAGVDLKSLLAAATINNAQAFGLDSEYGTIEVGKVANLLLLDANPLLDVAAYQQIHRIVLRGKLIEREQLSAEHLPAL